MLLKLMTFEKLVNFVAQGRSHTRQARHAQFNEPLLAPLCFSLDETLS